jgi:ParB-like chromosome segregation protein Spo0J
MTQPIKIPPAYPLRAIGELIPYAMNARTHSDDQVRQIAASIKRFGFNVPILVDDQSEIVAGHGRVLAGNLLGMAVVPCVDLGHLTADEVRAYRLADNQIALNSAWDPKMLGAELSALTGLSVSLEGLGFSGADLASLMAGDKPKTGGAGSLSDRFGIPPFTVLNAREGWWQERKGAWIALGIESELGRGAAPGGSKMPGVDKNTGTIVRTDSRARPMPGVTR